MGWGNHPPKNIQQVGFDPLRYTNDLKTSNHILAFATNSKVLTLTWCRWPTFWSLSLSSHTSRWQFKSSSSPHSDPLSAPTLRPPWQTEWKTFGGLGPSLRILQAIRCRDRCWQSHQERATHLQPIAGHTKGSKPHCNDLQWVCAPKWGLATLSSRFWVYFRS